MSSEFSTLAYVELFMEQIKLSDLSFYKKKNKKIERLMCYNFIFKNGQNFIFNM